MLMSLCYSLFHSSIASHQILFENIFLVRCSEGGKSEICSFRGFFFPPTFVFIQRVCRKEENEDGREAKKKNAIEAWEWHSCVSMIARNVEAHDWETMEQALRSAAATYIQRYNNQVLYRETGERTSPLNYTPKVRNVPSVRWFTCAQFSFFFLYSVTVVPYLSHCYIQQPPFFFPPSGMRYDNAYCSVSRWWCRSSYF